MKHPITSARRMAPPAWFLDGKPPPRWKGLRLPEIAGHLPAYPVAVPRLDWCPACVAEGKHKVNP